MGCALGMVRWLLFLVNFIFALGGLALAVCGFLLRNGVPDTESLPEIDKIKYPALLLMIVGTGVFIIAFFGCCGAVQESHCCIVTFGMMLLTLLILQVAIASYVFIKFKDRDIEKDFEPKLKDLIDNYYSTGGKSNITRSVVDAIQIFGKCCGYVDYTDFTKQSGNPGQAIPYSCCGKPEKQTCQVSEVNVKGCQNKFFDEFLSFAKGLGTGALVVAVAELAGVVFAFCLANSIRNVERRSLKV